MPNEVQLLIAVEQPPDDASIIDYTGDGPAIIGDGNLDLVCVNCRTMLAQGVKRGQVSNLFIRCKCGKYGVC